MLTTWLGAVDLVSFSLTHVTALCQVVNLKTEDRCTVFCDDVDGVLWSLIVTLVVCTKQQEIAWIACFVEPQLGALFCSVYRSPEFIHHVRSFLTSHVWWRCLWLFDTLCNKVWHCFCALLQQVSLGEVHWLTVLFFSLLEWVLCGTDLYWIRCLDIWK